jgi:hypothetical protein
LVDSVLARVFNRVDDLRDVRLEIDDGECAGSFAKCGSAPLDAVQLVARRKERRCAAF